MNKEKAEEILDKWYETGMHWKASNRYNILKAMKEYADWRQSQQGAVWEENKLKKMDEDGWSFKYDYLVQLTKEVNDISEDINLYMEEVEVVLLALLKSESSKGAERKFKYMIEDKREEHGKWLKYPTEPFIHEYGKGVISGGENTRWTNDPHLAIQWDSKEEAQQHLDKYFNMPDFEVTEHEFISGAEEGDTVEQDELYWKKRCEAAEEVIECLDKTEDFYLLYNEEYKKWNVIKQSKGERV